MTTEEKLTLEVKTFLKEVVEVRFKEIKSLSKISQPDSPNSRSIRRQKEVIESLRLKTEVQSKIIELGFSSQSVVVSVSHTSGRQGDWILVVGTTQFAGLGVDLEARSRKVHPKIMPRIVSPEERKHSLQPLEFWVAKEASFKANPANQNTFISQYRVVQWDPVEQTGEIELPGGLSQRSCRFKLIKTDLWIVALAVVCDLFDLSG